MSIQMAGRGERALRVLAAVVVLLPASGCRTARMELPETLVTEERMAVSGRQGFAMRRRIRFGSFETTPVRRSWTRVRERGASSSAVQLDRRQEYSFVLREDGAERWSVSCLSTLRAFVLQAGGIEARPSNESALFCNVQSLADATLAWELQLAERHERPLAGALSRGGERLAVVGTNRSPHGLPLGSTTGFEIREGDRPIGAVEVINSGAVWLPGGVGPERRSLLAAVAAALLALEDPRDG
jgi:hypothetical protein